ncbi:MAG: energy transducer TonB [Ferruginibacter sp.]
MSNTFFSGKSLSAALVMLAVTTFSCHNNDTTSTTDQSHTYDTSMSSMKSTDSNSSSMDTSNHAPSAIATDTSTGIGTSTMNHSTMGGKAMPNPAKKGMKGKATVMGALKGTGSMDMDNSGVYNNVEYIPSFPGGNKGLQKFFDNNLKYPEDATTEGVDGTVKIGFIVDENGKLTSPQVIGDKLGYGLDEEALRVVKEMPTWNPGKLKGKNVKTRYTLPVTFQLY